MNTTTRNRYIAVNPENHHLSIATGPIPEPKADEVLMVMGLEVAGTIEAVGADAGNWQVGDKVCALTHGGGYADYAVAPVGQCLPIPTGFSKAEAAALPEALLTVWHNIFQRAKMKDGDKVLIHGGASGIGTLGIQIAKVMGGEVYTTAGTDEKCQALEARGATRAVNYKTEDFESVFTELGLKNDIDVILDMIGGDYIQKNLNLAAPEGRIVNIAYQKGFTAEINFVPVLMKRITLTGSTLRAQSFAQKTVMVEEIMEHIFPHLESGAIKPIVDSIYPLEQVEQAQGHMEGGQHMGKIILKM
jgi:putative PIG3 family NAD(P)H quinone oxidoreductase